MKKNFKIISLLTVVTVMVNALSIVAFLKPASALTNASATLGRLAASTATGDMVIAFTPGAGNKVVTIPVAFTGTVATATASCTAVGQVITCTDAGLTSLTVTGLTNPVVGTYTITVADGGGSLGVLVPIVDSDRVDVTGYITSSMVFDLDTSTDNSDCAYNACLKEAGGAAASNYVVDLGNLTLAALNKSGDSVLHADAVTGAINYINFDLSTNAANGAVVTMQSVGTRAGYLNGPGTDTEDIPSVTDGATMTPGSAGYGYKWYNAPTSVAFGSGNTETINTNCEAADVTFCAIPTTATSIWSSTKSAQEVRGYLQIAAAINGTMVPGTYNDVLQFIATATY